MCHYWLVICFPLIMLNVFLNAILNSCFIKRNAMNDMYFVKVSYVTQSTSPWHALMRCSACLGSRSYRKSLCHGGSSERIVRLQLSFLFLQRTVTTLLCSPNISLLYSHWRYKQSFCLILYWNLQHCMINKIFLFIKLFILGISC